MSWYNIISIDLTKIPDMLAFYYEELNSAKTETSFKVGTIEKNASMLPGITENRFSQLQELESILEFLNIKLRKDRSLEFKKFLEAYNRALSSRDAEKYVDGVSSIVDLTLIINEVALLRNKYLAIMKGLEVKQWMISNITKLRCAGLEDISM